MCLKGRKVFGVKNKSVQQIYKDIITVLRDYFNDRMEGCSIYDITDDPYQTFTVSFTLYNYYNLVLKYNRGKIEFVILVNKYDGISLKISQTRLDKADLNVLCKELDEMVRLRIPDKYLAYYNWE